MKKLFALLAITALFASCGGNAENKSQAESETAVIETPILSLGEFETKAGEFVDKEVMVSGIVDHVCKHGGKKILLVTDDGEVHVEAEERFDEAIAGSEVDVIGIVREFRVDEAYCIKMEEDNIKSHSEGDTDEELYAHKMEQLQWYRDSMMTAGTDHLSFYSLDFVSLSEKK
jgi:hypothetical protein